MTSGLTKRICRSPARLACAVILLGELASAAWQHAHVQAIRSSGGLSFVAPAEGWRESAPDPAQVGNLHFNRGRRYQFRPSPEVSMDVLALEYDPGSFTLEDLSHPVEVCTAYAGAEVLEEFPPVNLAIGDEKAELQSILALDRSGTRWFVFKAVWMFSKDRLSHRERLKLVFRPSMAAPPALVLMASIAGVPSHEEARRIFDRHCLQYVKRNPRQTNGS